MAEGKTEIGKAYVQIVPSAKGISEGIKGALGGAEDEGKKAGKKLGGGIASGLKTMGTVIGAGLAAATAGLVAIGKQSIEAYADYEQLVGGVETLFKESADIVQQYAANAFKTAGLSANEYMETVTGFSASLLQSLGGDTEQAAKVADMAISDMSDNANKMGSSMESIQTAYQGFAKQNYTMLDNLKLGYGGTKTEMERLLADATAISGVKYDIESLSDVYEAIHVIQTELDITGTTAKEASTTISGSLASMKSAWQNLVVGIADDQADFDSLVNNFVSSVSTVGNNLLPRIETTLKGVGKLVEGIAPVIVEAIPILAKEVLPPLFESAASLFETLLTVFAEMAPTILQTIGTAIIQNLPILMNAAISLITSMAQFLIDNFPMLIDVALQMILTLADALVQNLPTLIPAVVDVILTIVDKLTEPDTLVLLVDSALKLMMALASGLIQAIPRLVEKIPVIIANLLKAIYEALPMIIRAGLDLVMSLGRGLVDGIASLGKSIWNVTESIRSGIKQVVDSALNWGRDLISNFIGGIKQKASDLWGEVKNIAGGIASFLGFSEPEKGPLSNFHTYAPDMMELFAKGIKDNEHLITDQIGKSFDFSNDIVDMNITGSGFVSGAGTSNHFGAVSINIYQRDGEDVDALAERVGYVLQNMSERRAAALA